jgi:hypothetical protein
VLTAGGEKEEGRANGKLMFQVESKMKIKHLQKDGIKREVNALTEILRK